jgi:hypothetical protein
MWDPEAQQGAAEPAVAAPEQKWEYATKPVAGQFIVRFKDYKMGEEHKQSMLSGLTGNPHWKYVDRNNAAARFPTDFALVEIELDHVEELKAPPPPLPLSSRIVFHGAGGGQQTGFKLPF